jgi:hypothetical protein
MAGSDTTMADTYTVVIRENALILSRDKDTWVTQYQPITRKDIPDWVIELLDQINGELGRMDALIQDARENNFEIQTAFQGVAKAYERLIIRQMRYTTPFIWEWKRWKWLSSRSVPIESSNLKCVWLISKLSL